MPATAVRVSCRELRDYSRLRGADEEGTLRTPRGAAAASFLRSEKSPSTMAASSRHRLDGLLVALTGVVDAVEVQRARVRQAMPRGTTAVAGGQPHRMRIGINLGDVIVEGDDSRTSGVKHRRAESEALADAGGGFVSNTGPR